MGTDNVLESLLLVADTLFTPHFTPRAERVLEGSSGRAGGIKKSKIAPFPSVGNFRGSNLL